MASEYSQWDYLRFFVADYLQDVHTIKPAVVKAVNGTTVDCTILTKTRMNPDTEEEQPDVFGVPLQIMSANRGNAIITVPITVGDLVYVLFSDRNPGELFDTDGQSPVTTYSQLTHNYDPVGAIPCFFTSTSPVEIDPTNIVIRNEDSIITIAPNGEISLTGTKFAIGDGTINLVEEVSKLAAQVKAVSDALALHQHAYTDDGSPAITDVPGNASSYTSASSAVNTIKTNVDGITL